MCNLWKSDKMFDSFLDLQNYLLTKWEKSTCTKKQQSVKSAKRNLRKPDLGKNSVQSAAETKITGRTDHQQKQQQKQHSVSAHAVKLFTSSIQPNQTRNQIQNNARQFAKQFLASLSAAEKDVLFAELGI